MDASSQSQEQSVADSAQVAPEWFYEDRGRRVGPVSASALREAIDAGRVTLETLVWTQGMSGWVPVGETQWQARFQRNATESVPSTDAWFYAVDGERVGPVDPMEMQRLVRSEQVGYGTQVWQQGMTAWKALERSSLAAYLPGPPPLASGRARVGGKRVGALWWLAWVPLWGAFVLTLVVMLATMVGVPGLGTASAQERITVLGMAVIYLAVAAADRARVLATELDGPSLWWLLLTPLAYLILRSRRAGRSQAPAVVWTLLFILNVVVGVAVGI